MDGEGRDFIFVLKGDAEWYAWCFIPHNYQTYATEFIESHPISAIFLSMGLGKTIITLTAIFDLMFDYFDVGKVLVIAPLRVCTNVWRRKWKNGSICKCEFR